MIIFQPTPDEMTRGYTPVHDTLPDGFRWANETETMDWDSISGIVQVVRRGTWGTDDCETDLAVPIDPLAPIYPEGTPEYDAYSAALRAELRRFVAMEAPYDKDIFS